MNLIGKIFVVLVFVMSLVFMAMSVAVYATHRNWRDVVLRPANEVAGGKPLGVKLQLIQEKANVSNVEAKLQQTLNELANAKSAREREVAELKTKLDEVTKKRDLLEENEARLTQDSAEAVTAMKATENSIAKLRNEIEAMRLALDTARDERDQTFKKNGELEDQLAQAKTEWERFRTTNEQLVKDLNRYMIAVQDAKLQLDRTGPPRLDGVVLAVNANDYLEVSLGSDDGLEKGHEMDVYRLGPTTPENKYLGRIRIVEAKPDKSVAQVLPNFKRGTIQKEDRVATRLN